MKDCQYMCTLAPYYALMADECTDVTTLEELSIFLSLGRTQPASEVVHVASLLSCIESVA